MAPNDADAHYKLALAYKTNGLVNNAIDEYEVALRLMPIAAAHNNLGMFYDFLGISDKDIEHYQASIRLQPNDAGAYNNLGIVYAKMGLIDNAVEHLEKAVRIDSNDQGFDHADVVSSEVFILSFCLKLGSRIFIFTT